jgi:hypothetical protein
MSHQAAYKRAAPEAVDLARAAGRAAMEAGIPAIEAESAACSPALDRAERTMQATRSGSGRPLGPSRRVAGGAGVPRTTVIDCLQLPSRLEELHCQETRDRSRADDRAVLHVPRDLAERDPVDAFRLVDIWCRSDEVGAACEVNDVFLVDRADHGLEGDEFLHAAWPPAGFSSSSRTTSDYGCPLREQKAIRQAGCQRAAAARKVRSVVSRWRCLTPLDALHRGFT